MVTEKRGMDRQGSVQNQSGQGAPPAGVSPVGCGDVAALLGNAHKTFAELPAALLELAAQFADAGFELSLVGGPVRDAFLGVVPHDFDLATSATPDETERLLKSWADTTWDVGKQYGTVGARKGDLIVEVTTYRTEEYTAESRKPQVRYGQSLEGDLSRRDFTVNAVAMRLPEMVLVDPFNGLEALADGRLETPVEAAQSFEDDPLRIMRAARFAAQLAIDVDYDAIQAMQQLAGRLAIISPERIRAELERLMISPHPRRGLELLVHTGAIKYVLPELADLVETTDEHGRHKDVYQHTLTVLDQAIALETGPDGAVEGPDFILRFAALMHDIGKPATRRFDKHGAVSFHHHEIVGAKITRKRMRALRFDKATTEAVTHLIAQHLRFHGYGEQAWTDSAVRRYVTDAGDQLERLHLLTRADCTTRNRRKAAYLRAAYDDLEERIEALQQKEELAALRPSLDGKEIMELLGLRPGPDVGRAYGFLMQLRLDEGPLPKDEAAARLTKWWQEQQ